MTSRKVLAWLRLRSRDATRSKTPALSPRCSELVGRAQLANLLAERAFRPPEPWPYEGGAAVGCELARQGIYWGLLAHREQVSTLPDAIVDVHPQSSGALEALYAETDLELLAHAARGSSRLAELKTALLDKSFVDFAALERSRQLEVATLLHAFSVRLVEPLATRQQALERAWLRRMLLVGVGLVALFVLAYVGSLLRDRHELQTDLAPTALWKASSQYNTCSCKSPQQTCDACPSYFFHTVEENQPSIMFDFGREQSLSKIIVENRRDCCEERAVPLLVEVSRDKTHWQTIATRQTTFTTWEERFPTVQARWVKLSVPRRDLFHLARVRLLP